MYRWVVPGLLTLVAVIVIWRGGAAGLGEDPNRVVALIAFTTAVLLMVIARWFDRGKGVWLDGDGQRHSAGA